jgi:hypothetical protein
MTFLCALAITSGASGCADFQVSSDASAWQLQSEADYYLSNLDTSLGYKTLKAPINFASLNDEYRVQSRKVSELTKTCRDWAVLETINLSIQSIDAKWLCVGGPSQGAGEFGVEDGKGFFKLVQMADVGSAMSAIAAEFDRSEPIDFSRFTSLDASAVFVTVKRGGVFRRARYDANAGHFESDYPESRNGQDTPFDKAYLHFLEAFDPENNASH